MKKSIQKKIIVSILSAGLMTGVVGRATATAAEPSEALKLAQQRDAEL